jgi:hypothetical protein
MSGRGLRARSAVNYNDKQDMVPAWLKGAGLGKDEADTPPKRSKKASNARVSDGSAEKENTSSDKRNAKESKQTTGKSKPMAEKPSKDRKEEKKSKAKQPAARGRNAGVAVVPIGESKVATTSFPRNCST